VDATNKDGRTQLHLASSSGTRAKIVHLLLDHGANADAKNKDGRTSLYEVLSQGKDEVVRFLLDRGVDANTGDKAAGRRCTMRHSKARRRPCTFY
jgi:ankyrin repeat protein